MFYSVASPDWKPGQPLTPSGALLFRTRSEAEAFAPEAPAVAVAVRFDARRARSARRGRSPRRRPGRGRPRRSATRLGGVTVFGADPRRAGPPFGRGRGAGRLAAPGPRTSRPGAPRRVRRLGLA